MEDILEFHQQRMENAKAANDFKKIIQATDDLHEFVTKNKEVLKSKIDSLQVNEPSSAPGYDFGGAFLVASGSVSTSAPGNASLPVPGNLDLSASSSDSSTG